VNAAKAQLRVEETAFTELFVTRRLDTGLPWSM
jgi:hypothetical protein